MARKTSEERNEDLLQEISENITSWYSNYSVNLQQFRRDKDFLFLEQWDASDRSEFKRVQKPMLTFNKVYDFFKKVVGEQRQNTPNLEVRCLDGDSSQEAITLRSDIVRQIAYGSKSDIVYQTAFENALAGGFGAIRVVVDYESPKSFNQHIFLRRIENPERIFFDPNAKDTTKHDGGFCGYYDIMNRKEFKQEYPDIRHPESFPAQSEIKEFNWGTQDTITVVEYYKKEWFSFSLYKLSNGKTVTDKEYRKIKQQYEEMAALEDISGVQEPIILPEIISTRKSRDYKIMCYKAIYGEIIEKYEWTSKHFPLIFCPGDVHIVEGEERTISFVRFVKDAQRFLNYCGSEIAQAIKNSRREQFLVTPDNISGQGLADMWRNPALQQGALVAKPDPLTKQMPIKLPPSEIPQTLLAQYQRAEQDIQSVLGFYEANRGAAGQELSGVALRERQRTGNMAVAVFFDNLDRAIEQTGRVILSLLPGIYDTERKLSMQSPDGKNRDVIINRQIAGDKSENDVKKGEYDVIIKAGPSFAVQKEEALRMLIEMAKINPQVFPLVADLIAENIDIENGPQLVERFKTLVPQNIVAKEAGQPPPPPQPNPQMMMMQQEMQLKQAELKLKQQEQQIESEKDLRQQQIDAAKAEIEMQRLMLDEQIAKVKAGAEIGKAQLNYQGDIATSMSKILTAQSNIAKHSHNTARELLDLNR